MHGDVQVARRRTAQPGFALAGQPDALTVLDARRDPDVDGAGAGGHAGALALVARVLDDRAAAPALGARLGEAERTLVAVDHARAVAVRAHLRAGARTRAAAMAVGARRRAGQPQRHRHALGGLEEDSSVSVSRSLPRRGRLGRGCCAPRPNSPPNRSPMLAPPVWPAASNRSFRLNSAPSPPNPPKLPPPPPPLSKRRPKPPPGEQPPGLVVLLALGRSDSTPWPRTRPCTAPRPPALPGSGPGEFSASSLREARLDLVCRWRRRRRRAPCRSPSQPILAGPSSRHLLTCRHVYICLDSDSAACSAARAGVAGRVGRSSGTVSTTPTMACRST